MFSVLAGIFLITLGWIASFVWRGQQLRKLVESGVPTQGTVERIWSYSGAASVRNFRLRYAFHAPDGHRYSRAISITAGEKTHYREGQSVEIIYLPEKPGVNALSTLVDQARQALNK